MGNNSATNQRCDGWMRKDNRATRAARFLEQIFDVVCQMTTSNFHTSGSDDNASSQL